MNCIPNAGYTYIDEMGRLIFLEIYLYQRLIQCWIIYLKQVLLLIWEYLKEYKQVRKYLRDRNNMFMGVIFAC